MSTSKHIVFWTIAARNVRRFPGRALAILVPLFLVMACASAMTFIKDGILHDALASVDALPDITVQQLVGGRMGPIGDDLAREFGDYGNVKRIAPRIWGYVPISVSGGSVSYTLMGIDPEFVPSPADLSLVLESGSFIKPGEKHCAVVGAIFAHQKKVKPGDEITLKDELGNESRFSIVGIFSSRSRIYSADLIITDIESARAFFGYAAGQSTDLCLYVKDPLYIDQVASFINASHKNIRTLTKEAQADIAKRSYGGRAGIFQLMWLILLCAVLVLAWAQASSISLEMKKEIGVQKALGWQTLDIIELKMMEILIIGSAGILGGIICGILFLNAGAPLVKGYFLGWTVVYPDFPLPMHIEWSSIFLLVVTGLIPLCAATVFPAWLMGTIEPDSAIRGT
jgi:ABC-type lipoprotein release transport system permease subunit